MHLQQAVNRQQAAVRLVERCAGGDPDALAELHDLYREMLLRFAKRIVRTAEAAEGVVQEVFVYVWQRAGSYDDRRSSVSTWLVQITRSRAIDYLRRTEALQRTRSRLAGEGSPPRAAGAESDVLAHQRRRRLGRALQTLPTAQRQAIVLAYYNGMTQTEIAHRTRIPLGTVKTRTYLAIRRLRAELAPEVAELT